MTRREWCAQLAILVSPSFPAEAQAALVSMLPAMQHLPNELFTDRTILAVASGKRRQSVPAWDEIINALNEYRRTYLPDPTLRLCAPNRDLPPGREAPSPEEVAIVTELLTSWRKEQAQARIDRDDAAWAAGKSPLRDVTASGQALSEMRLRRFAGLLDEQKITAREVPEPYRAALAERRQGARA